MAKPYVSSPLPLKLAPRPRRYLLRFMRESGPVDRLVAADSATGLPAGAPVLLPSELTPPELTAPAGLRYHYFCENCHFELLAGTSAVPTRALSCPHCLSLTRFT